MNLAQCFRYAAVATVQELWVRNGRELRLRPRRYGFGNRVGIHFGSFACSCGDAVLDKPRNALTSVVVSLVLSGLVLPGRHITGHSTARIDSMVALRCK